MKISRLFIVIVIITAFSQLLYSKSTGMIAGKVTDSGNGNPLPGANVFVEGTVLGAATDLNGEYIILNVNEGTYNLVFDYIGYEGKTIEVTVVPDEYVVKNIELKYLVLTAETIEVTAQVEGQMQAINQQITATSVKNIVSSAKIQELPESNAAEAVGRLPGVSLQREGGEGNKVVIRGLSPQFNKISINGVTMAATGDEDRSVDLSMMAPNMLDGIEVSKTAMADQEADQIGGIVDFILRGAPEKPMLNLMAQGGYNGLRNEAKNYYFSIGGGMRFFDNKLGLFAEANLKRIDRSSNSAAAAYEVETDTTAFVTNVDYQDVNRINERVGGVLVLDYKLPSTKIKLSNTINNLDGNTYTKQESFDAAGRNHNYQGLYNEKSLFTLLSSLTVEQSLGDFLVTGSVNYSQSKTEVPNEIEVNASETQGFFTGFQYDSAPVNPFDIQTRALNNIANSTVNVLYGRESKTLEEEISATLNFQKQFVTDFALFDIKIGGAYKYKNKEYNFEQSEIPLGWQDMALSRLYLSQKFNLTGYDYSNEDFPYAPFIDADYDAGDFSSGGNYTIGNTPHKNTMLDVYNEIKNLKSVNGVPTGKTLWYDYTDSHLNDYNGNEDYYAAYVLPKIIFAKNTLTFIPGLRYENYVTEYTANRSEGAGKPTDPFIYYPFTSKKSRDYFLPMIHLKYQVNDWFDIRTSYTQTISRPNYNRLIPTWSAFGSSITWNNVDLKPAKSQNLDIFFSFYASKIGLFSIGLFEKRIEDFTFATTTFISDTSQIRPEWPETVVKGGSISGYTNSTDIAELRGIEVEWQSNFWFLPGALRGLVTTINYTYADSKTMYPRFVPIYERVPGPLPLFQLVGTEDQSYSDRLLDQPTHILNITVGFDYAGFSIRGSMQYKSDVFVSNNFFEYGRSTTEPLTLWDVKIAQKLPLDGLQIYLNLNNLSKAVDQTSNSGTGWFTERGYYGPTADLGIIYSL